MSANLLKDGNWYHFFVGSPKDPFDRPCFIIDANEEIFPARNDQRVIRPIVGHAVVMEPIVRRRMNELAGIVSAGPHGCADDVGQVPRLQNPS